MSPSDFKNNLEISPLLEEEKNSQLLISKSNTSFDLVEANLLVTTNNKSLANAIILKRNKI